MNGRMSIRDWSFINYYRKGGREIINESTLRDEQKDEYIR